MSTPISDFHMHQFAISSTNWKYRIISRQADRDNAKKYIFVQNQPWLVFGTNAFWGRQKRHFQCDQTKLKDSFINLLGYEKYKKTRFTSKIEKTKSFQFFVQYVM